MLRRRRQGKTHSSNLPLGPESPLLPSAPMASSVRSGRLVLESGTQPNQLNIQCQFLSKRLRKNPVSLVSYLATSGSRQSEFYGTFCREILLHRVWSSPILFVLYVKSLLQARQDGRQRVATGGAEAAESGRRGRGRPAAAAGAAEECRRQEGPVQRRVHAVVRGRSAGQSVPQLL